MTKDEKIRPNFKEIVMIVAIIAVFVGFAGLITQFPDPACVAGKPCSSEPPPFEWKTPELVFQHDGCKIYQFKGEGFYHDGYQYFAKCN